MPELKNLAVLTVELLVLEARQAGTIAQRDQAIESLVATVC